MNKDIQCLRDLWYSIDPTSPIGSSDGHQKIVQQNREKFDQKLVVQRENAALKIRHLRAIGQEICCEIRAVHTDHEALQMAMSRHCRWLCSEYINGS